MVISELILKIKAMLSDNATFEARELVMNVLQTDRNGLIINSKKEVSEEDVKKAVEMAKRRQNGEPLQYIIGATEFMSLEFITSPFTLIPRSDTETLVETALDYINGKAAKVLDIGTGTGCIGISMAFYNKNISVTLADFKEEILLTAKKNAAKNNVDAELCLVDILKDNPSGKFDMIVSNPPYIESDVIPTLQREVKSFEPLTALDGGSDGLIFYKRITEIAPYMLNKNGALFFEIGYNQGEAVFDIMSKDFENINIVKDLCGNDRVIYGSLR